MKYAVLGAVLSASLIATALPAFAEPGKGHGKGKHKNEIARLEDNLRSVHFGDDDRERIQEFIVLQERRDCPPGLAKKGNGCLPPGQAKKYRVGEVLRVDYPQTIWHALADLISPAPKGFRYERVDHDVLLIDNNSNRVVDVVSVN